MYLRGYCGVIKCGYYPLSAYATMVILDYYLNLYANLNNAVITICKVTQFMIISYRGSLFYKVIDIWSTQRKEKKEEEVNVVKYDFEIIVKKNLT